MIRHNGIEIDIKKRTIIHVGKKRVWQAARKPFKAGGFEIWMHMIFGPISLPHMFDLMYGDHVDGGPSQGLNHVRVRLSQMRYDYAPLGLKLVREKRSGIIYFHLVPGLE